MVTPAPLALVSSGTARLALVAVPEMSLETESLMPFRPLSFTKIWTLVAKRPGAVGAVHETVVVPAVEPFARLNMSGVADPPVTNKADDNCADVRGGAARVDV